MSCILVTYAVLSALQPHVADCVTQQKLGDLEQHTEAAWVAELTQNTN